MGYCYASQSVLETISYSERALSKVLTIKILAELKRFPGNAHHSAWYEWIIMDIAKRLQ